MDIIFDTSIWIEYLKGKSEYFDNCQLLLERGQVKTVEVIFAELLQGALNKREIELIKDYYKLVPKLEIDDLFILAGEFSCKEKLLSKGIGLIDSFIITATIKSNSKLWTLDKKIKSFLDPSYLFQV